MNPDGYPPSLEPLREGNTFAVKSGIYSRTGRVLAERAQEIAERLLELPHVAGLDAVAAEEIGSVVAKLEAIDLDLERGVSARGARTLLEHKAPPRPTTPRERPNGAYRKLNAPRTTGSW